MLVGGDFRLSSWLVLIVLLFIPVICLLVRRKWRLASARKEEIKRLLILASEEAARAELEATAGYGVNSAVTTSAGYGFSSTVTTSAPRQLQYLCAVCFCPTATRCARCKAVRYCSGKCQIIHWRQGHKEECRPFDTTHQNGDVGGSFALKAPKQDEYGSDGISSQSEGRQCASPIDVSFGGSSFSTSYSKVQQKRDAVDTEYLADEKERNSMPLFATHSLNESFSTSTTSNKSSGNAPVSSLNDSDECSRSESNNVAPDKFETNCANTDPAKTSIKEQPNLVNSVDNVTSSAMLDNAKQNHLHAQGQHGSSSSLCSSVEGSSESSFSEPSTLSSGFWDGAIDSRRSRTDILDDSAVSGLVDAGDGNMSHSLSSINVSHDLARSTISCMDVQGSNAKKIKQDDSFPTVSGIEKPTDGSALLEEMKKDYLKSRRSPSLSSESTSRIDVHTCNDSDIMKSREPRCDAYPISNAEGHSINKSNMKVSILPSLSTRKTNNEVNDTSTPDMLEFREESLSSKASDANLSFSNERHLVQNVKPLKIDTAHGATACSSQFTNYSQNPRNGLKTSMWKVVDQLRASKLSRHSPLGVGSETPGRYNNKGLFPYELFVMLYNWNSIELSPCGLTNCGNSCYANAVLQCLAFTPPLTAYFLQGLHSRSCQKKEWCFTCEFEHLVMKVEDRNSPLSPMRILSQIENNGSPLGNGREEDAHEFLRYAIDAMQSVCLKEAGVNASGSLEEETTLIGLTFGGYLRSKIKCMKCGGKSERHERMMDLTVEIEGDIGTLEDALQQFTGTEILDGENKYQCSRCKSYEKAKKKLTILEAPNVLTVALKRYQSGKFGKLNKSIHFPEILDLAPYMSGTSDKSPVYRLYGVVVHLDIMNASFSGHYVCYVKNIQNKWFKIDDSIVKPVELERVLTKGAYMLLYARCSPRAPRLIRNSIIPRDTRKPKNPTKSRSHSTGSWDCSLGDPLNGHSSTECFYQNQDSSRQVRMISEEDSSSDNASSLFSEGGSCSTESSNRDSTSTEDYVDQIFGDVACNWNGAWRNSSDSETSSSSSSPSPLYSRRSPHANLDRYVLRHPETRGSLSNYGESVVNGHGGGGVESLEGWGRAPLLYSDSSKQCRKLDSSSSCRETNSCRLGQVNPFDNLESGVSFRRSLRERMD